MHYRNYAQDWGGGAGEANKCSLSFGDGMQGSCTNEENLIM